MSENNDLDITKAIAAAYRQMHEPAPAEVVEEEQEPEQSEDLEEKKKLDPVGKADADIDNDGDVDSSDEYLKKRRAAISKAMKEELELEEGMQDKKAVAAMKAMLDGMSMKKAVEKFGVSPKKLKGMMAKFMNMNEVEEPRAKGEKDFKDKHDIKKTDLTPE